jgi:photosystem II stability/assembly factor-like uncharacterized protein
MANSTIIYACTDDGLAIFNKPGTLSEWLPPRRVLQGQKVASAWSEPGPPIRVVVVADGKLLLSESGGRMWDEVGPQGIEGVSVLALDYDAATRTLRAVNEDGSSWISADAGTTWDIAPREEVPPAEPTPEYAAQLPPGTLVSVEIPGGTGMPSALVAGTAAGLEVSPNGGGTWTRAALPYEGSITALERDPERRDRLYAATSTGYLFESGHRGQSWEAINDEPAGPVRALFVLRI